MWCQVKDNKIIKTFNVPKPITIDGIQHPDSIFKLWTEEELKVLGLYRVQETGTKKNDTYYNNIVDLAYHPDSDTCVSHTSNTEKSVEPLKTYKVLQVKQNAAALLTPTDWKVIRAIEDAGQPVETTIKDYRAYVRTTSNEYEAAINLCTVLSELEALQLTFMPYDEFITPTVEVPPVTQEPV